MSQTQTQQIEPQELTPEQIQKLVELAQKENRIEARLLLILEEWVRQGSSYEDSAKFEVIYGEADVVKIETWNEGYPYRKGTKYLIVPKTVPTVIVWRHKWDYGDNSGIIEIVYVFTTEGWKKISV
jgi:hypothetical protein